MRQSTLFFLSTRIGFASHSGCSTSLMNHADTKRANSARIASLLSSVKRRSFYRISLACGYTFNLCSTISLGTPGISVGCHANTSRFILQEPDERAFLFVIKAGSDDGCLALIRESQINPLNLFSRSYRGHDLSFISGYCEILLLQPGVRLRGKSC
jgi:hypothetical protein